MPKFKDADWNSIFRPQNGEDAVAAWRAERADLSAMMSNARAGTHGRIARRIMELSDLIAKAEAT